MSTPMNIQSGASQTYRVVGVVRFADGSPAPRMQVTAVDRDLRNEQPLGESQTDERGVYRLEYAQRQFLNRERGTADLVVKVLAADGSVLAASPTLFNAPSEATVDLAIPAERYLPATLFERISVLVEPLIAGVPIEEL